MGRRAGCGGASSRGGETSSNSPSPSPSLSPPGRLSCNRRRTMICYSVLGNVLAVASWKEYGDEVAKRIKKDRKTRD